VMILTGDSSSHLAYARPALEQGLPTYIDNPIAPDPSEAQTIFELADRHGGACFTGSALRYAAEFAVARAHAPELIGSIEAVYATSRGTFDSYIVHVLEIANHFVRDEVEELQARRVANRDTILVQYRSGQTATLEMIHPLRSQTYAILLYGPRGHHYVELTDFAQPFITLIGAFLNTARGAPPPVSASDTIYQLELVAAARESLQSGRPARAPSRGTDLSDAATWPAPRVER
jgi:predicted dehydrogenase